MRFVFDLGADWAEARRLILEFVRKRVPGAPLGPKWEPPAGSLLALKLGSYTSVSESDAKQIAEMESKVSLAQPLVPVRSKRELSSTHTRFSSLSPSFCRNKTAPHPRSPSVSSFPPTNNKLACSSNNNKSVQGYESVERCREAKKDGDESELPCNNNTNVSRSGVVESGMIFIVNDERGGGKGKVRNTV